MISPAKCKLNSQGSDAWNFILLLESPLAIKKDLKIRGNSPYEFYGRIFVGTRLDF